LKILQYNLSFLKMKKLLSWMKSAKFQSATLNAPDSKNIVIGKITPGRTDFILEVKSRKDIEIMELTLEN